MLNSRLLFSTLLATALAACGPAGNEPEDGGAGSGGTEAPGIDCHGSAILELDGSTSPAVVTANLDSKDGWFVSCAPDDTSGYDALIHFRAGEAGTWRFSTEGTSFDTILYALRDCNDGFTELACNDDWGQGTHSQLVVPLEAGQEIFVVVDTINVRQSLPFTLTASVIDVDPAVIETIDGFHNRQAGSTGVRFSGVNPDSDLLGFSMQLYASNGAAILGPSPFKARFSDATFMTLTQADGAFQVEGSFRLDGAPAVARIEISVYDQFGLVSETVSANVKNPEAIARGAACDPNLALNLCPTGDACIARPPSTVTTCSAATAPTLATATATVNLARGTWGVVVEGVDAESDAVSLRLLPRNEAGTALAIVQGATVVPLHHVYHEQDGSFRGVAAMGARFDGPCLPPAQSYFNACVNGGRNQDTCYAEAIAMLEQCYVDTLSLLASVDVEVVDLTGKRSALLKVEVGPVPEVDEGGSCDPYGGTGACPEGFLCWADGPTQPETCQTDGPICPEDFGAIDLNAHAVDGDWIYKGNNAKGRTFGASSCGGGGKSEVLSFTAPAAGTYRMTTSNLVSRVDTVLVVRPFCQLSAYELACNDDAGSAASALDVRLAAGETVYIFVDSAQTEAGSATSGNYTLTVSGP